MDEMVECVAKAIEKSYEGRHWDLEIMAIAAIEAMRTYLKEHDDGFQCQQCNAMVDVDAAFGKIDA
jgi:hypothetical protein